MQWATATSPMQWATGTQTATKNYSCNNQDYYDSKYRKEYAKSGTPEKRNKYLSLTRY